MQVDAAELLVTSGQNDTSLGLRSSEADSGSSGLCRIVQDHQDTFSRVN
jgi:hypothetical protein